MLTLYILGSVGAVSLVALTGLFAISFSDRLLRRMVPIFVSLAVGALLGDAILHLLPEAFENSPTPTTSLLVIAGILAFFLLEKFLRWHHHGPSELSSHDWSEHGGHVGRLILIADAFHNFIDGVVIAVSYQAGIGVGIATTAAVLLHEIPQEIGDFGVLIHAGYTRSRALLYNFLSALFAIAGAVTVLLIGNLPESIMRGALPFAAGIFLYIAGSDLIPELQKGEARKNLIYEIIGIALGILAMYSLLFIE